MVYLNISDTRHENFHIWLTGSTVTPCWHRRVYASYIFYTNCCRTVYCTVSVYLGRAVTQWLRCCATNRKVAGLITYGVIGIFHWHNPSDRTMALGSTQPVTEMSTRIISWGWRRPVRKADNLTSILGHCHVIWEPQIPGTLWATPGL